MAAPGPIEYQSGTELAEFKKECVWKHGGTDKGQVEGMSEDSLKSNNASERNESLVGIGKKPAESACGSKEFELLSRFPSGESRGGAGSPRAAHAARQPTTLARIDACGSPRKRDFKALR